MFKKLLTFAIFFLTITLGVLAQNLPDKIDDYHDDWDEIIEQLDDSGYLDEDDGELFFEDNRIRFEDDELFISFDSDEITDFVMAATLQIKPDDDEEYEFCMLTYRDDFDEGYLGTGIDGVKTVVLYDFFYDSDAVLIEREKHDEDVDEEIHLIIIALDDEITVYQDGELIIEEDDLTVREGVVGLYRSEETDCDADDVWVWKIEGVEHSSSDSDSGDSSSSNNTREQVTYYVRGSNINVRACPQLSCSVVDVIGFGDEIQIVDINVTGASVSGNTTWMEGIVGGQTAFIHSSLVSRTIPVFNTAVPQSSSSNSNNTAPPTPVQAQPAQIQSVAPQPQWSCAGDIYNCGDFNSCSEATSYFNACPGDPSGLDRNNDGIPCNTLCGG